MAPTVPQAAPGGRRADLSVPKTAVPERGLAVSRDPVRRADSLALEPVLSTHRVFEAMDPKRAGLEILHADLFDARPQVVLSALAAVGALGDERSFTVVARVFAAAGEDLRCAAARTLGKLRGSAAPRLLLDAVRTARSEKVATSSSICPDRYSSSKTYESDWRGKEQITFRTRRAFRSAASPVSPLPALLQTIVRSRAPWASTASMRSSGIPAMPKPLIIIVAPSFTSATAVSSDLTTLLIIGAGGRGNPT